MANPQIKKREENRGKSVKDYIPLLVILAFTFLAAMAKQADYGTWNASWLMRDFMGFFLVVFSMFKFFDLDGFADGFQMYDLLAQRSRTYALSYPAIELGLGLGFLTGILTPFFYSLTIIVMIFGAIGVARALAKGLDTNCACMGTALNVPLSTVALTEDLGMAGMAVFMLVAAF